MQALAALIELFNLKCRCVEWRQREIRKGSDHGRASIQQQNIKIYLQKDVFVEVFGGWNNAVKCN